MKVMDPCLEEKEELQKQRKKAARRNRRKARLVITVIVLVLILLVTAAAWLYGGSYGKKAAEAKMEELTAKLYQQEAEIQELRENPIVVTPVAPEINMDTIYHEIHNIGELATVEYLFTDAAKFSDSKQIKDWNIPFTEKSFLLKWSGVIKAGVDLEKVTVEVIETVDRIVVAVPQAKILSYEVDNDSVEVLNEQDSLFNNITVNDKIKFDAKTEEAMKERAIENGLLIKAQENTEDIIRRLLTADPAIGDRYVIEFVVSE